MKRSLFFTAIGLVAIWGSGAGADGVITGSALLSDCEQELGACYTYVLGVADGLVQADNISETDVTGVCSPAATGYQLALIVKKYLYAHVQELHL